MSSLRMASFILLNEWYLVEAVSDTGIGSCLEEFQDLKFSWEGATENWGM